LETIEKRIQGHIRYIDEMVHEKHHEVAKKYDLTVEQFNLLIELDELCIDVVEPINAPTVGQVADALGNAKNTMSDKISRLEKKGLIARSRDEADRRVSRILVSEKGRSILKNIRKEAAQYFVERALKRMDQDKLTHLEKSLADLCEQLQKEDENTG